MGTLYCSVKQGAIGTYYRETTISTIDNKYNRYILCIIGSIM